MENSLCKCWCRVGAPPGEAGSQPLGGRCVRDGTVSLLSALQAGEDSFVLAALLISAAATTQGSPPISTGHWLWL